MNAPLFDQVEREVIDEMKRVGGFVRDEDVLAYAIWVAASLHLGVDVPRGVFDLPWTPTLRGLLTKERRSA